MRACGIFFIMWSGCVLCLVRGTDCCQRRFKNNQGFPDFSENGANLVAADWGRFFTTVTPSQPASSSTFLHRREVIQSCRKLEKISNELQ